MASDRIHNEALQRHHHEQVEGRSVHDDGKYSKEEVDALLSDHPVLGRGNCHGAQQSYLRRMMWGQTAQPEIGLPQRSMGNTGKNQGIYDMPPAQNVIFHSDNGECVNEVPSHDAVKHHAQVVHEQEAEEHKGDEGWFARFHHYWSPPSIDSYPKPGEKLGKTAWSMW